MKSSCSPVLYTGVWLACHCIYAFLYDLWPLSCYSDKCESVWLYKDDFTELSRPSTCYHTIHTVCTDPRKDEQLISVRGDLTRERRVSHTYLGKPLMQAAKSLVIKPASMVSMQTSSKAFAKKLSSLLLSSFALWANPRDQAKMEAKKRKRSHYFKSLQV